jgi:hypothetical protein
VAACGVLLLSACAQKPALSLERQLAAGDPPAHDFDPVPPPNGMPKMPKIDFAKPFGGTPPDPKLNVGQAMQKEFDRCIGSGGELGECMQQAREAVQHMITPPKLRSGEVIIRDESEPAKRKYTPPPSVPTLPAKPPTDQQSGPDLRPVMQDGSTPKK